MCSLFMNHVNKYIFSKDDIVNTIKSLARGS